MHNFDYWVEREKRIDEMTRQNPMVIKSNPMIDPDDDEPQGMADRMHRNRERLYADKAARLGLHGNVYSGIMNIRYNG